MRFLIALLLVLAVGTGVVAYGPGISFRGESTEVSRESAEIPVGEDDEQGSPPPAGSPEAFAYEESGREKIEEQSPEPKPTIEPAAVQAGEEIPGTDGLRVVTGTIRRTVNHTLADKLEREVANPLSQVVSRVLVWWMEPSRDLRPGDEIGVVFSLHDGEEPRVHAVSMKSQRHGRTFSAYRFQPAEERFGRMYTSDAKEVEKRMVGSPIKEYEQITSLLWDGRGHNGIDFKTPVGTEVYAPFDGRVVRRNWSTRFNGNCIDIRADNGKHILFLHLESFAEGMVPGRRVERGELIALSGNTGRSTAPHLHYEARSPSGRILDPFDLHETYRKEVPESEKAAFEATVEKMRMLLGEKPVVADAG